jgi:hypothetical protein
MRRPRQLKRQRREVLGAARGYYQQAGQAYNFSARAARPPGAVAAVGRCSRQGREWMRRQPREGGGRHTIDGGWDSGRALALPALGVTLLGTERRRSLAVPQRVAGGWSADAGRAAMRTYLRRRRRCLAAGRFDEAERERLRVSSPDGQVVSGRRFWGVQHRRGSLDARRGLRPGRRYPGCR